MDINILEEKIRKRAYEIYIRRTKSPLWLFGRLGTADGDWAQAEKEILHESKHDKPK